jgi:NAD(P)-dependent dehydrogenase (short-subunit alcohol dehydrogenase family)
MKEKILIVTGGSRGIGRQIAMSALEAGWRVAVSYKFNKTSANELVQKSNGRAKAFPLDLLDSETICPFFSDVCKEMGVPSALVNAAGIDPGPVKIGELTSPFIVEMMTVNVTGLMLCCDAFLNQLRENNATHGASIVNISSMASTIGGRAGKTVYAASKGAVDVFTVGLAKEVAAEKVSAFSVRPGVTITDMTEKLLSNPENATKIKSSIASQEMANPLDIAEPVIDLISGRFAYASGSLINLGGGGFVF